MERNGLSESDAGKLGALKTNEIIMLKKHLIIEKYNSNPKLCSFCNKPISYDKRYNKFCCKSCAASFNNLNRDKEIYKHVSDKLKQAKQQIKYCSVCGCEKSKCIDNFVCNKRLLFNTLIKFGFDISKKGTIDIIDEFYRVRNIILNFYIKYGSDSAKLKNEFNYISGSANFHKILKSLNIRCRNISESLLFSIEHNKRDIIVSNVKNRFHTEYHKTWDNRIVYLRSSYETEYANILDAQQIYYDVELLRLRYFDTLKLKFRIAVPDFYIKEQNLIVEIKSLYTLDVQNLKDKVNAYKKLGYNFKLILEHEEVNISEI